jgi:hypothetical protein
MAGGGDEQTATKRRTNGNLVRQTDQRSIQEQTRPHESRTVICARDLAGYLTIHAFALRERGAILSWEEQSLEFRIDKWFGQRQTFYQPVASSPYACIVQTS